jgi:hypothetical protein
MTFFRGSRYEHVPELELDDGRGRLVRCKQPRIVPDTPARRTHLTAGHERVDVIAHEHFSDAERYWRICDTNRVLWPPDLVAEPGRTIGIPGSTDG